MIIQFVPSLTSVRQEPAVAGSRAVPAAPPASGTTLLALDVTALADMFLNMISRPAYAAADGRVTTMPAPLQMSQFSAVATLKLEVFETGAPRRKLVADASPNAGVTRVGEVAKTKAPVPVSSVTALARLAELGVARKVAMPAAKPATPVLMGKPVQLVNVPDVGVPNRGVTSVGLVENTKAPVPVSSVTAAAIFAEDGVAKKVAMFAARPDIPVDTGRPVQFVNTPEAGVPNAGVTMIGLVSVGDVPNTSEPVPVSSVMAVIKLADDGVARNAAIPAASPATPVDTGSPVQFDNTPDAGVPRAGVVNTGLVSVLFVSVCAVSTVAGFCNPCSRRYQVLVGSSNLKLIESLAVSEVGAPVTVPPALDTVNVVIAWVLLISTVWPSMAVAAVGNTMVPSAKSPIGVRIR